MGHRLNDRATYGDMLNWAVIRHRSTFRWIACSPFSYLNDRDFDTFAEAIAYADKEARK